MSRYTRADIEALLPGGKWQADGEYLMKSPLREEKTASFRINLERAAWVDFGTGEGGKLSELFKTLGLEDTYKADRPRASIDYQKIIENGQAKNDDAKRAEAVQMWNEAEAATDEHWYVAKKGHAPEGLRVTVKPYAFDGDVRTPEGTLLVPAYDLDGNILGVERILHGEKKHRGKKKGCFFGDRPMPYDTLYLCEGWATSQAVKKILGEGAKVAQGFSLALMPGFADEAKKRCQGLDVVFCPDATENADTIERLRGRGLVVELPAGRDKNFDWDDEVRAHGIEAARAAFQEQMKAAKKKALAPVAERPRLGIQTISAKDLRLSLIEPPKWAVEGLIPEGITILAGRPKGGKSWLILQACLAVASGQDFLGHRTTRGKVLYAALEDTKYRLKSRIGKLWADDSTVPEGLLATTKIPRLNEEGISILEQWIKENRPRMVVLDTWAKAKDVGDRRLNAYEQDVRLVSSVKRLADEYGLCLVLVHHLNKLKVGDENWLESLSGSMGLSGTADAILSLKRDMGQDDAVLKRTGRDFEETDDIALEWTNDGWVSHGAAKEVNISNERHEILKSIEAAGEPVSPSYIAEDVGKRPVTIRVLLQKMVMAGQVKRTSNGRYQLPPPPKDDDGWGGGGNGGNTVYGGNAGNGGNAVYAGNADNRGGVTGVTGALPGGGNAVNAGDSKGLSGSVTGVTGVTAFGELVNNSPLTDEPTTLNVAAVAERAGVDAAALWEGLQPWIDCGRARVDGDGGIVVLPGTAYPGEAGDDDDDFPILAGEAPEVEPGPTGLFPAAGGEGPAPGQSETSYRLFGRIEAGELPENLRNGKAAREGGEVA